MTALHTISTTESTSTPDHKTLTITVDTGPDADIEDAYYEIKELSERLHVNVRTVFNGVELVYHGQTEGAWERDYVLGVASSVGFAP